MSKKTKIFSVEGMGCAACQARVEKAVLKVLGVETCAVSLLTNSMSVEGDVDSALIIKAVEDAGYKASEKIDDKIEDETLVDKSASELKKKL